MFFGSNCAGMESPGHIDEFIDEKKELKDTTSCFFSMSPDCSSVPVPDVFIGLLPQISMNYLTVRLTGRVFKTPIGSFSMVIFRVFRSRRHNILGPNIYIDLNINVLGYVEKATVSWWNFMKLLGADIFGHFYFQRWACKVYTQSLRQSKQNLPFMNPLPSLLEQERRTWCKNNKEISVKELIDNSCVFTSGGELSSSVQVSQKSVPEDGTEVFG